MSVQILNALIAAANERLMPGELLRQFCQGDCGAEYGVDFDQRVTLARNLWECCAAGWGRQASLFPELLLVCESILSVPASLPGAVAEFGCWHGFSSACLSLACKMAGRKLIVFDSFTGLPLGGAATHISDAQHIQYRPGDYHAGLDRVRAAVVRHGVIEICEFVPGLFAETLPLRTDDQYVCVFEDADLVSSVKTVLDFAWPRLQPGCKFFSHEARDLEVMQLFFDAGYWHSRHNIPAPGISGAGLGLSLCVNQGDNSSRLLPLGSCLAYALKRAS